MQVICYNDNILSCGFFLTDMTLKYNNVMLSGDLLLGSSSPNCLRFTDYFFPP